MNLDKKRWIILICSCLINLCIGSLYAWSVFAGPMADRLGVESGALSLVFTLANAVGPVTMISGGFINDKFGARNVILAGGILFGAGMIACGFANSVIVLYLGYGLGCGLGMGMIYGCTIGNSIKFFPERKGFAGGISTMTYGISSVILPPIANMLIENVGINNTFKIIGLIFGIVICFCSCVMEKCPDGYAPKGYVQEKTANSGVGTVDKDWKGMLSSPVFYVMIILLICGAFTGLTIISQASSLSKNMMGYSAAGAALIVSVLALFNSIGRVCAGMVSDKIGRIGTIRLGLVLAIVGIVFLLLSQSVGRMVFLVGMALVGICFGTFMGVFPGFTAERFGMKHNTVNYGIMFIGFALAGIIGPISISKIYMATGSYGTSFIVAACFACIGLVLTFIYQLIIRKSDS
ncbi:MAG: OFA family MFS transporter [Eubacterium sp.]|nr:OFA family MFS transporter [Eubacterium sp.]